VFGKLGIEWRNLVNSLPVYVWALVLVGLIGTTTTIVVMLWRGALTADLGRRDAASIAATFGICWGTWVLVSARLAQADVYRFEPAKPALWFAVAMMAPLAVALLSTRHPAVARILRQPDALWMLTLPQVFRPLGVTFLIAMALGHLPAAFALPAGLGDMAVGVEAIFVARALRRGDVGRRVAWFNVLGLVDLLVALAIGITAAPGLTQLLAVSPTTEAISLLPLALIPTTVVPLAVALHLLSLRQLRRDQSTNSTGSYVASAR
jgi:hypothetical protein